jgi:hypothetical protein
VTAGGKVALGLLGLTWMALGVAFVGVFFTPRHYCSLISSPSGETVTAVGLLVATCAVVVGTFVALAVGRRLLVVLSVASVTVAAGVGVDILSRHFVDALAGCP